MKLNVKVPAVPVRTHEGAPAARINTEQQLRRSVLACLLWESQFYEEGQSIADRIAALVPEVQPAKVAALAIEAREKMNLRHVPLLLVREMARHPKHKGLVGETLTRIIQRADELSEFLAIYWASEKQPLSKQVRLGLGAALKKFDEYALAKYNRDAAIKLRDVMFLVRPKPENETQAALWKRVADDELTTPDTWEVSLSAKDGVSKKDKWERLLRENKLGALALLRNLRNFADAGVDVDLIRPALAEMNPRRVLPFRFIAAARHAPRWEPELEQKMFSSIAGGGKLSGETIVLVDVSGSMDTALSAKSDMTRIDAACGVAMVAREMCERCRVYTFSSYLAEIAPRRGFSLRDAITGSQSHMSTYLGDALARLGVTDKPDRIIVITDEQSHDKVPEPGIGHAYMINVASYQNGVGYGKWMHIDGFSEAVLRYIVELENTERLT